MNMLRFYFIWKDFGNVTYFVHRTLHSGSVQSSVAVCMTMRYIMLPVFVFS